MDTETPKPQEATSQESFITEEQVHAEMQKTHWASTLIDESPTIPEFKEKLSQWLEQQRESGQMEKPEQLNWQTIVQVMTHEMNKETAGKSSEPNAKDPKELSDDEKAAIRKRSEERNNRYNEIIVAMMSAYAEQEIHQLPDIMTTYNSNRSNLARKEFWGSSEKAQSFLDILKKNENEVAHVGSFLYGSRMYDRKDRQLSVRPSPATGNTDTIEVAEYTLDRFNSVLNTLSLRTQMALRAFNPPPPSNPQADS